MNQFVHFLSQLAKGIGQIVLQESVLSGSLLLAGIWYGSFTMGLATLVGVICGTSTAILLRYEKEAIEKGLYGFNAALVGAGVIFFMHSSVVTWLFVILGSIFSTVLQRLFTKHNISAFTLPFVLSIWLSLPVMHWFFPDLLIPSSRVTATNYYTALINGFGQIIFQGNTISGCFFLAAVLVCSPLSALYGLAGAVLSVLVSLLSLTPIAEVGAGLHSYNAILCAIALTGRQLRDSIWAFIAVVLSSCIELVMLKFDFVLLTFPFVLASMLSLAFKQKKSSKVSTIS